MSKVWVDREILERACMRPGRESLAVNDRDIIERGRAQAEIRELLAQPAEADGVEVVGYRFFHVDHGYIFRPTHIYEGNPSLEAHSLMTVAQHQRILSAVTAERDAERIRADVAVADANDAERERDKLRAAISDPESVFINMKRGTIAKPSLRSMIDLYGDVVNGDEAQLLEIARLRAEVENLRRQNNES